MNDTLKTFTLRNGCTIPSVGFGTYKAPDGDGARDAVCEALRVGYRHIDAAARYENEKGVGAGIRASGVPREEIFVTSKVWNDHRGYDRTMASFEKTMADLGLETLDLFLIHWPAAAHQYDDWEAVNRDTWRALTTLYKEGRVRAIGVSNFFPHHLRALMDTEVPPMVDQIEYHPGHIQAETVAFCRANDILVEAWSPLGRGRVMADPLLNALAVRYGRSVAQICLRWCLQNGVVPLPKSTTPSRIRENIDIFDFSISDEDMARVNDLPAFGWSGQDPDHFVG